MTGRRFASLAMRRRYIMLAGVVGSALFILSVACVPAGAPFLISADGNASVTVLRLGLEMAASARLVVLGTKCRSDAGCDRITGCARPDRPSGTTSEILPENSESISYVHELQAFRICAEVVLKASQTSIAKVSLIAAGDVSRKAEFIAAVKSWNGEIFWEPASKSQNTTTRLGDEARSVFGPIPAGDCNDAQAKTFPIEVNGDQVDLVPNLSEPTRPLQFAHRNVAGKIVSWTTNIARCDKPSLAGSVSYCGLNSRLNRVVRGNVEWLFFCRKSSANKEVTSAPYWRASDPRFAVYGVIGYNQSSGEMVFFDGRKDRQTFTWSQPFPSPGGRSYEDTIGRRNAEELYDTTFQIPCHSCHDNKSAYVVDPHAEQARVGYLDGGQEQRARKFSLGDYLPLRPRRPQSPIRVIGSAYTSLYGGELERARTVVDPSGSPEWNCTSCHTLTTQATGRRFAADAVAKAPWITDPQWSKYLQLMAELEVQKNVSNHRTTWATEKGSGKIFPWMLPIYGNEISNNRAKMSDSDWRQLSDCIWQSGRSECHYGSLYSLCPAPEGPEDSSALGNISLQVIANKSAQAAGEGAARLSWTYANNLGGVPTRDDVRVNVAIREAPLPVDPVPPNSTDFPTSSETVGMSFSSIDGDLGIAGDAILLRNTSAAGHQRWTDPSSTNLPRDYSIEFPTKCGTRYLIRLLPERFCFDQSNLVYSSLIHLSYIDVHCR